MFNFHFHIERWKWNTEYECYVSTDGRVKDHRKQMVEPIINGAGYMGVIVNNRIVTVHRLVIETFKGQREDMTVDHIDGNKRNNALSNLEYVPYSVNQGRAILKQNISEYDRIINYMSSKGLTLKDIREMANCVEKGNSKSKIVAMSAKEWVGEFKRFNSNLEVPDDDTFAQRVELKARTNKTYCGYRLSINSKGEIVGIF